MTAKTQNESVRLFKNPLLEALTHVHPATPIIMWGPVAAYLYYYVVAVQQMPALSILAWFLTGLLVWTLTEYCVHKYGFHFETKSKVGQYLVFLFHGIHHDYPEDKTRLVMPPAPAIILMAFFYGLFSLIVPPDRIYIFMASFTTGYLCYDYIHYGTHHWPMKSKVGRFLRKYHLQHHYSCPDAKFGVSNPLWDYVFGTVESRLKKK